MSLALYQPYDLIQQLNGEMNRLFSASSSAEAQASQWRPAVDIRESDAGFAIVLDVPGVDPADIEITADDGELVIQGKREASESSETETFCKVERVSGTFYRRFRLPDTANAEAIAATSEHGVLTVSIPKQEKAQPRKIAVSVNS
ncbi:heat shock protein Hsp20 [gamma proteobacterium HTCC5015]|nr:heat shock protein Hsp20 [gamma proteobacterium HTCC5015]